MYFDLDRIHGAGTVDGIVIKLFLLVSKIHAKIKQRLKLSRCSLPVNHLKGLGQYLETCFFQITAETGEDLAIGMDIKWKVGRERELLEFAHADLPEAHVCTFHEFWHEAEHGSA